MTSYFYAKVILDMYFYFSKSIYFVELKTQEFYTNQRSVLNIINQDMFLRFQI